MVLELMGHEVRVAYSGWEGVHTAKRWSPDVVLCDIGLPDLDGCGVACELRQTPETAAVRLIAITAYSEAEDRRRTREAGFDHHLVKPADLTQLQKLLAFS
jgi:CheY-like chemotaxis protein